MGKRGPPPTPTRILEMRDSWRAEARKAHEPQAERGRPVCPAYLDDVGKKAWRRLARLLDAMGLLYLQDENALARYCDLYSMWRKAQEFIEKNGQTYPVKTWNPHAMVVDDQGLPKEGAFEVSGFKEFPQVRVVLKLAPLLLKLEKEFGLTPSARAGLADAAKRAEKKPEEESGKERLFAS